MDLGLDIARLSGRPSTEEVIPAFVRAITPEDLERLFQKTEPRNEKQTLKKITERHHALARCLASGMKDWEAAAATGYSHVTISILKSDPTFKELMEFYRENTTTEFRQFQDQMLRLRADAVDSLHDDLENGELSPGQKIEVVKMTADRTGFGPQTTATHNHNFTVDVAKRAEQARKRLEERRMIDITPKEAAE